MKGKDRMLWDNEHECEKKNVLRRFLKKFLSKTAAFKQRSEGYIELDYEFFNGNDYVRETRVEESIGLKQTNKKEL